MKQDVYFRTRRWIASRSGTASRLECVIVVRAGVSAAAFETRLILDGQGYYQRSHASFDEAETDAEVALLDCASGGWEATRVPLTPLHIAN